MRCCCSLGAALLSVTLLLLLKASGCYAAAAESEFNVSSSLSSLDAVDTYSNSTITQTPMDDGARDLHQLQQQPPLPPPFSAPPPPVALPPVVAALPPTPMVSLPTSADGCGVGGCMHVDDQCGEQQLDGNPQPGVTKCGTSPGNLSKNNKGDFFISFGGSWDNAKSWLQRGLGLLGGKQKMFHSYTPPQSPPYPSPHYIPPPPKRRPHRVPQQQVPIVYAVEPPPIELLEVIEIERQQQQPELPCGASSAQVQPCLPVASEELIGLGIPRNSGHQQQSVLLYDTAAAAVPHSQPFIGPIGADSLITTTTSSYAAGQHGPVGRYVFPQQQQQQQFQYQTRRQPGTSQQQQRQNYWPQLDSSPTSSRGDTLNNKFYNSQTSPYYSYSSSQSENSVNPNLLLQQFLPTFVRRSFNWVADNLEQF